MCSLLAAACALTSVAPSAPTQAPTAAAPPTSAPAPPATAAPAPATQAPSAPAAEATAQNVATTVPTQTAETMARQILARMTLEQRVGQVFMLGFEGTTLNASNRKLIHDLHLGGVTLFARNIDNAQQLAQLDAALQTIADPVPLFVSVDQEGGLVVRVTEGATIFPGNMAVGATGDPVLARRLAEASADELLAMGVNMDLAPVVDVNTNPLNPVIGVRAFGSQVDEVAQLGAETVRGLQDSGVSAVAKHFPGHGDTAVDSHLDLPVVPHSRERLESTELRPFQAAMQAGVDGIMTAHLYVPSIEPEPNLPATLSHAALTGLLRQQLGFQGLILTDALDMDAIKRDRTAAEAAVEAFGAGADMLLIAGITAEDRGVLGDGPPALLAAVRSGRVSEARLDESVLRVLEAKLRRGVVPGLVAAPATPDRAVLNSAPHRELALYVARKAVTLQRDAQHVLPLRAEQKVLVINPGAPTASLVKDEELAADLYTAVRRLAPATSGISLTGRGTTQGQVLADARAADVLVLAAYDLAQSPEQQALARALQATGKPLVVVSLRGPYDARAVPEVGTVLTVYGDRPVHVQAAAEALFGVLTPSGRAP
jgi:beta-N-acetylhexosaminidase